MSWVNVWTRHIRYSKCLWSVCRVPDECPQAIADLYQACTSFDARQRPKASEVMRIIEGSMLAIPGAPEAAAPDPGAPSPKEG